MPNRPNPRADIRPAATDDVDLVVQRRLAFLADVRATTVDSFDPDFIAATRRFVARTHTSTLHTWLAESEGECVGVISLVTSDAPPRPEEWRETDGYVVNVHVDAAHRRRGIARRLLEECLAGAAARGVRRVSLHTTDDGRPLYEQAGFAEEPGWMQRYG